MTLPSQSLPVAGQPNSTEDPKVRSAIQELQAIVSALDSTNLAAGAVGAGNLGAGAVGLAALATGLDTRFLGASLVAFSSVGANGLSTAGSITASPLRGNSLTLLMLPLRFTSSGGSSAFWGIQAMLGGSAQGYGSLGSLSWGSGTDQSVADIWTFSGLGTSSRTWQLRLENGNTSSAVNPAGQTLMLLLENL